jgi:acetylornithine deacetylase
MSGPADHPPADHPLLGDALGILDELVAFPSVALTPNVDLIGWVVDRLDGVASDVRLSHDPTGTKANLFATIGPAVDGGITPPFEADHRDGRVYGRGTADMKGFVACVLAHAPGWAALDLERPIHVALTYDEEDGFHGAPVLIESLSGAPRPAAAIVGEPTGLQVIGAHKGCYEYTTTVTGMDGHSSRPSEAVSAVHHATRWIGELLGLAGDLAELCLGTAGRTADDEVTLFKSVGLAVWDLMVAGAVVHAGNRSNL